MGKVDFFSGVKTLEETSSPVNGKIVVIRSLGLGTYIQVNSLTQSGGILYDVWKKPLKKVASSKKHVERVLVLGLGGGTVVKLIRKYWPKTEITGVDIDPVMVKLGKKYLKFDERNVNVIIDDAFDYLKKIKKRKYRFDLILTDLYIGFDFPKKFETEAYIKLVKSILAKKGVAIFNRLYFGEKRSQAVKFGDKLEKVFRKVDVIYPEANIMFVCYI